MSEERVSEADFVRLIGPDYFNSDNEGDELEEISELWVPAKVQGEKVMFCVDSGASRVIMKSEQYLLIPANKRPKLASKNVMLRQADGTKVQIDGVATMTVQVGECKRQIQMYVAPVRDNLLGLNFLRKACAQIDLDKLQIVIGNERVDCRTRDDRPLYSRILIDWDITVPGGHEMVVPGQIAGDWGGGKLGMLEPVDRGMLIENGVLVARGLVGTESEIIPIRVMNVSEEDKLLKGGTVLARMFPVYDEDVQVMRVAESSVESDAVQSDDGLPEHLWDILERCSALLAEGEIEEVVKLLTEYQDVFSAGEYDIGRTGLIRHRIGTPGARPRRQTLRRTSPEQRAEIERQVKELKERDLIRPSDSAWASPVVLVGKKDGSKRLCIDYRKLNEVTEKDAYPLPRIDDSLDALGGAKYFSTLDLASGYWQVEMDEDARAKSAFVTNSGLYEWNVLPFGLCNAPSTFERLMDFVLAGLRWETLLVYLDDVIVFGRTVKESIDRLREVLIRFRNAGLKLKPSKCNLFQSKVNYLGHVVSSEGIQTDPDKIEAIRDWPRPITKTQVRSFLGTTGYYRRFVLDYAKIAQPLHKVAEKNGVFEWNDECENAFNKLKIALISAPILAYPMEDGDFIMDTDASNFAIGCVLSQVQDNEEKVIAYGSKALSKEERNYCVTRRELLAVVEFLKKYKHYLGGRPVTVRTDHGSLRWLFNFKNPEQQLARWLEVCASFNLIIEHRAGKKHQNADGLSRRPCKQCGRWDGLLAKEKEEREEARFEEEVMLSNERKESTRDMGVQTVCEIKRVTLIDVNQREKRLWDTDTSDEESCETETEDSFELSENKHETVSECNLSNDDNDSHVSEGISKNEIPVFGVQCIPEVAKEIGIQTKEPLIMVTVEAIDSKFEQSDTEKSDEESECYGTGDGPTLELPVLKVQSVPEVPLSSMREAQLIDESIAPVLRWKEQGERPDWKEVSDKSPTLKCYWSQWDMLAVKEGVLVKRWESDDGKEFKWLLVLPRSLRKQALDMLHSSKTAGHLGREKTMPKVRERYYWVGMSADVRSYLRQCVACAQKKGTPKKHRAPLQQLRVGGPLERIAIDVLGPLTETHRGNVYILVVGDYWTKWMEAYPIPDQQAETVASKLVEEFVCRFGVPTELHSDQGRNFESGVFQEMCKILGIRKTRTTPYNPKSDGLVERYNRTIVNAVSLMILPHQSQRDWDEYVPFVGMAYRSSVQASTGRPQIC